MPVEPILNGGVDQHTYGWRRGGRGAYDLGNVPHVVPNGDLDEGYGGKFYPRKNLLS